MADAPSRRSRPAARGRRPSTGRVSTVPDDARRVSLGTVAREWTRIGLIGFGGPPAHIVLLRQLVVERRGWLDEAELEDAISATNLLPGPASTQLAIFCAGRVAGPIGRDRRRTRLHRARSRHDPRPVGVVPGAIAAASGLSAPAPGPGRRSPPWPSTPAAACSARAGSGSAARAGVVCAGSPMRCSAAPRRRLAGPYLVLVLIGSGLVELGVRTRVDAVQLHAGVIVAPMLALVSRRRFRRPGLGRVQGRRAVLRRRFRDHPADAGRRGPRLPLDDRLAVPQRGRPRPDHPRPSGRDRRRGRLRRPRDRRRRARRGRRLRALVHLHPARGGPASSACAPIPRARAFLDGSGPAAIGAILGAAIPLAGALHETWQFILLGVAAGAMLGLRAPVVPTLLGAAVVGVVVALAGGPVP